MPTITVSKTNDPPFDDSDMHQVPDWEEWAAVETLEIQNMASEAALRGWLNDNEKTLVDLGKDEPKIYEQMVEEWNQLKNYAQQYKNKQRI